MNFTALTAVALGALALAGCTGRYYDRGGYYHERYDQDRYGAPGSGAYYSDRDRYNDRYYSNDPNRDYRDRDRRYRRDEDN